MLVAVLAQLELTSHQWEISSVNLPKWQTFISSRLTLSGFETLKESLLNQKAFSGLMGLAVASWEQQLGEESSNWEQRAQPVPTGRGLLGGTAATQCLAVDQAGRASRGDVLLLPLCFLQHPTGLALLLATRCEQGRKTKSLSTDAQHNPVCWL